MNIAEISIDEAKMNPTSFANAIGEGGSKGVLVGFEFEVCVPEKTIKTASKEDRYVAKLLRAFKTRASFYELVYSRSVGDARVGPATIDRLLRPRQDMNPVYPTFADALKSIPRYQREFKDDYSDLVRQIFPGVSVSDIERNLGDYFEILNAAKLYKILLDFWIVYEDDASDGESGDYQGAAAILKPAVEQAMNADVTVFKSYHQSTKNMSSWYIEPDSSLYPTNPKDGTAEVVSPPLPAEQAMTALKNFYAMAKQLKLYTSADNSTGLHINVSIPGTLDVLKLAVFLGEEYVLNYFNRENNDYVKGVINTLRGIGPEIYNTKVNRKKNKVIPGKQSSTSQIDYSLLKKIVANNTIDHFASISNNGKYISFRHAGGDYLNDYAGVLNVVGRFVQAMIIASDPNLYKQEYVKKLVKLFGAPQAQVSPKMAEIQSIRNAISTIKSKGLPVLQIAMSTNKARVNWHTKVNKAISDQGRTSRIYRYFDTDRIILEKNSQSAKNLVVNSVSSRFREDFEALDVSKYAAATILPNVGQLAAYYSGNIDSEGLIWYPLGWSENDRAVNYMQSVTLPFNDPRVQQLYKQLLQSIKMNESREYPENPIYYFAYGMLTDPKNMPGLEMVGVAELRNFEYKMYQFANVEPNSGSKVYGTLWAIDRNVLSHLDKVESYPEMYDRRTYPVYCDGTKYEAEVYVMTPHALRFLHGTFPKEDYIKSVARGYIHAGVPTDQLKNALVDARAKSNERTR